ncbi:hypothetical protein CRE_21338 [Caenorhabditis remanei]|uniref:Uncharacterized protein n=1 Tax=Caenorhabditis remanei TaxID=31234 RepID=E3MUT9_CAERE|nr:hypothetical protein CRE_21338 [Caenorhabditis remanei]
MNKIPLQYESLKAVLLYMEPNVRFKLGHRLPSIRLTEKIVPLRIESLELTSHSTKINDTEYLIGLFQEYNPGEKVPKAIQNSNEKGGVFGDLDQYGFFESSGYFVVEPGDVALQIKSDVTQESMDDSRARREREYKYYLQRNEEALAAKLNPEIPHDRYNRFIEKSVENLEDSIDLYSTCLQPYERRRKNLKVPYVCHLQLTIKSEGNKQTQRYPYEMKHYVAVKRLNTFLFGGRRSVIKVQTFNLSYQRTTLRLPIGFRISTKQVKNFDDITNRDRAICSMLDPSSFPLDRLHMDLAVAEDFDLPWIQNARTLYIGFLPTDDFWVLATLFNWRIFFKCDWRDVSIQECFEWVSEWIENERPVGSCFSFGIKEEEAAIEHLEMIRSQVEGSEVSNRFDFPKGCYNQCLFFRYISVPTAFDTRLEVFYIPVKDLQNMEQIEFYEKSNWIMKLKIAQ